MIDLYAAGTSNGMRARIALEECGLAYTWNDALAKSKCCAGDEVTVADLSLYAGYWRTKGALPDVVEGFANLSRWADMMAARPGIQRALKV